MTRIGKITAVLIGVSFVVLYVRRKSGLDGSALVTLGLSVAYLAHISLYIVSAIKGRISGLIALFWIYAVSLFYTGAIFFNFGPDSFERISEILSALTLLIAAVLIWFWTRKNADKSKYALMFWDFVPIWTGVLWLGIGF